MISGMLSGMRKWFRLASAVMILSLLVPAVVVAECVTMPTTECVSTETQEMHCPPAAQLRALDQSTCCQVQSAPVAPPKDSATVELSAAVMPVKASGLSAAPAPSPQAWTYHDPPRLQDQSQTQALLCVFLI